VDPPLAAEETEGFESPGLQAGTIDKESIYGSEFQSPLSSPDDSVEIHSPLRSKRGAISRCAQMEFSLDNIIISRSSQFVHFVKMLGPEITVLVTSTESNFQLGTTKSIIN